jgi:hypothetical protein
MVRGALLPRLRFFEPLIVHFIRSAVNGRDRILFPRSHLTVEFAMGKAFLPGGTKE